MAYLIHYSQNHPELSAPEALASLTRDLANQASAADPAVAAGQAYSSHFPAQADLRHLQQPAHQDPNHSHPTGQQSQNPAPNHFISPAPPHIALPPNMNPTNSSSSLGASPSTVQMSPAFHHLQHPGTDPSSQQHTHNLAAPGRMPAHPPGAPGGLMPTSVAMAHSMSHQNSVGTGSAGPSANASPNMTTGNKLKRRQSTHGRIKAEGGPDDGGIGGGGNEKVKQSPRPGKRTKGGNQ